MCGKTDEFTYNGETFTAKPMFKKRASSDKKKPE